MVASGLSTRLSDGSNIIATPEYLATRLSDGNNMIATPDQLVANQLTSNQRQLPAQSGALSFMVASHHCSVCSTCAAWDEKLRGKPCKVCKLCFDEANMYVCDKCEECVHLQCIRVQGDSTPGKGPWFCQECRGYIVMYGFSDITEDIGLLDYLFRQ